MSVDQTLLHSAENDGQISLRFYEWSSPTVSLGYFQSYARRETHLTSLDCPLIRRASGGGAIVHHHELTYSLCLPSSNRWSSNNSDLYELLHRIVIQQINAALTKGDSEAGLGEIAELYPDFADRVGAGNESLSADAPAETQTAKTERPFLCFLRRTDGDIVIGESKVVGSAQHRLKKSLIQHGSILIRRSPQAPELAGINDLGGKLVLRKVIPELVAAIEKELKINFENAGSSDSGLSEIEKASVAEIQTMQFGNQSWNERR